ncbi:MAG: hypothetical protein KFH87_07970 [Bacteroidetes bacterium]|nr:hypothetical protein [Bacteroidota bacterium]
MLNVFAIAFSSAWDTQLSRLLAQRRDIRIGRMFYGGENVVDLLQLAQPDIIVIDGSGEQGLLRRVIKTIMEVHPLPIVILMQQDNEDADAASGSFLDAGALRVFRLPAAPVHRTGQNSGEQDAAGQLVRNLALMAEVRVIRRWDSRQLESFTRVQQEISPVSDYLHAPHVVAIGASAGGTKALQHVFAPLCSTFPLPILVVQHIAGGYVDGLARWLDEQTALRVIIAKNHERIEAGTIYLAPDNVHLTVDEKHCILLSDEAPVNGFRPSIDHLFGSMNQTFGAHTIAVLLSGMGNDGAKGMHRLHSTGALTIAQDKETSLIHGIPGEAIKLGAVSTVLPVQQIGPLLLSLVTQPVDEEAKTDYIDDNT